jgi:hypothetical protein
MIWQYIGLVLSFAFRRSTIRTDVMQILAASALPAFAKFAGLKMPESASGDVLAYIGLATIAFIFLRLVSAPFFIWREQIGEIGALKLELSAPERIELERMAKLRAKKRVALAAEIRNFHWTVFGEGEPAQERMGRAYKRCTILMGQAGIPQSFDTAFDRLFEEMKRARKDAAENGDRHHGGGYHDFKLVDNMTDYLHGRITAEDLALRLPPDTEAETQP